MYTFEFQVEKTKRKDTKEKKPSNKTNADENSEGSLKLDPKKIESASNVDGSLVSLTNESLCHNFLTASSFWRAL